MQDFQISIWKNTNRNHPFKSPVKVHQSGKAASPERQPSFVLWSLPGSPPGPSAPPPLFPLSRGSGNRFAALSRPTYPAPRTAAPFSATPSLGAPCRLALRTAPKSMAPPPPPPPSPAARLPNCPRQSAPNYTEYTQKPATPLRRNDLHIQAQ